MGSVGSAVVELGVTQRLIGGCCCGAVQIAELRRWLFRKRQFELVESYSTRWRQLPVRQRWMAAVLTAAVIAANLWQPYPEIAWLQHIPTILLLALTPVLLTRWRLSDASVGAIVVFLLLHTLAGRYTYSNVPYDAWSRTLTGQSIDSAFGWTRNNFDRLVHLSFGLLAVKPVTEAMQRHGRVTQGIGLWIAFLFVCGVSSLYEIFEWLLTIILASDLAGDYNGQQGDVWDAQKDMAIAIVGACSSILWSWRTRV